MKRFLKRNKILSFLLFCLLLSILLGFLFYANLDDESRGIVYQNILLLLKEDSSIFSFFISKFLSNSLIWLLGLSILGILIIVPLTFFQVFLTSFEMTSMISVFGISKIFCILLYFLPNLLFLCITFFLCYYSFCFSNYLFQFLFLHKNYSFTVMMKKYLKIYFISLLLLIISTVIEFFILPISSSLFF